LVENVYSVGKQRLFYISNTTGNKTVEAEVINPSLIKNNKFVMVYLEEDVYYTDITFRARGSYVFKVYENGELKLRTILKVNSGQHLFYPSMDDVIV